MESLNTFVGMVDFFFLPTTRVENGKIGSCDLCVKVHAAVGKVPEESVNHSLQTFGLEFQMCDTLDDCWCRKVVPFLSSVKSSVPGLPLWLNLTKDFTEWLAHVREGYCCSYLRWTSGLSETWFMLTAFVFPWMFSLICIFEDVLRKVSGNGSNLNMSQSFMPAWGGLCSIQWKALLIQCWGASPEMSCPLPLPYVWDSSRSLLLK